MSRKIPHQTVRAVPGKLYVCEIGLPTLVAFSERRLAGPFNNSEEAAAALGALEAKYPKYQARTEVWMCPDGETEVDLPFFATVSRVPVARR
jgi:hypothetical protein